MDRGIKFMEKNYLNKDSMFVKKSQRTFTFKANCKASMKKDIRKINVVLKMDTRKVVSGECD